MSKTTSIDIGTFTNVGIGDPTPTRALDIRASADTTTGLKDISLIGTNKGDAPMLSLKSYLQTSTAENRRFQLQVVDGNNTAIPRHMVLQPDGGNVGIGTTNPSVKLDVIGRIKSDSITGNNGLSIASGGTGNLNLYNGIFGSTAELGISIAAGGNVGIGTTDVPERLRVEETRPSQHVITRFQDMGNDDSTVATGDGLVKAVRINSRPSGYNRGDGLNYITYLDLAVDADNAAAGFGVGYGSSSLPAGQTDLSNCEIVLKPGRVGIGTANPTTGRLHVIGGNSVDEGIVLGGRKDDGTSLTTLRFFHDDEDNAHIARGADPALTIGANKMTTAHSIKTKYGIVTDQTYAGYGSGNSAVASINQHGEGTVFHVVATRHIGTTQAPQLEIGYVAFSASGTGVYHPVKEHASISVTYSAVNATITATNLGGDATIRIAVLQVA